VRIAVRDLRDLGRRHGYTPAELARLLMDGDGVPMRRGEHLRISTPDPEAAARVLAGTGTTALEDKGDRS
jgi:hypothetical protein